MSEGPWGVAVELGRLRWLAQRERVDGLAFKKKSKRGLNLFDRYERCVDDDWSPSLAKIVTALINYGSAHHLSDQELAEHDGERC